MGAAIKNTPKIKWCPHGILFDDIKHLKKIFIVREPTDRFASAFFFVKKHFVKNLFDTPEDLLQSIMAGDDSANKFLKKFDVAHEINGVEISTDWVFNPQHDWIHDPYRILIYERLEFEIAKLNRELKVDITLPRLNVSEKTYFEFSPDGLNYLQSWYSKDYKLYRSLTRVNN